MSKLSERGGGCLAIAGVLIGALLLGGCPGPAQIPELVQRVIVVESDAFSAGRYELEANYEMPEITAEVAEQGTVEAYIDLGLGEGTEWTALPYAYQYPEKWAALVTYRYREGRFALLIVSPDPGLRRTIAERIDGYRVKVVVTAP